MTTDNIIKKYLSFSGERSYVDFAEFHKEVTFAKSKEKSGSRNYICLDYIEQKLFKGLKLCLQYGMVVDVIIEDTLQDIEKGYDKPSKPKKRATKSKQNPKKGEELGKIVDRGKVTPEGNSDRYWGREGIDLVFLPNDSRVRTGTRIDSSYKYHDMRFLENYYGLRAFEFGNWLSQQDRVNYLSGLGLALFDLSRLLEFPAKKLSIKGKLAVSFGARGRGRALAHFEPQTFTINLTRYSRPQKVKYRPQRFRRVNLILNDGGVGSFAHEYGHALDYFGGMHIEKGSTYSLSGDDSTNPKPDLELLSKNTLRGLMEKLMFKIIWKNGSEQSDYYKRLRKVTSKKYYKQRNEIFARAFEVYVQYKLAKKKGKNIFLNKVKYNDKLYLTHTEMRKLEPDFDALIRGIRKHL